MAKPEIRTTYGTFGSSRVKAAKIKKSRKSRSKARIHTPRNKATQRRKLQTTKKIHNLQENSLFHQREIIKDESMIRDLAQSLE